MENEEEIPLFFEDRTGESDINSLLKKNDPEEQKKIDLKRKRLKEKEKLLTTKLFGDENDVISNFGKEESEGSESSSDSEHEKRTTKRRKRNPVWEDEDDSIIKVDITSARLKKLRKNESENQISASEFQIRLRNQFQGMQQQSNEWADLNNDNTTDKLFRTTENLTQKNKDKLPQDSLEVIRVKDANIKSRSTAVINSVEFHPQINLLLTAGNDKYLKLFQVDGKNNNNVHKVLFKDLAIKSANFSKTGSEIIVTGKKPHFYSYDLPTGEITRVSRILGINDTNIEKSFISPDNKYLTILGKHGYIFLVSMETKHLITKLKMNGTCTTGNFSGDSNFLNTAGCDGEVYIWDLKTRRCIHKYKDDGSISATAFSCSPNSVYQAVGSDSGVVNVYNTSNLYDSSTPTPAKALMNLTTKITTTKFNHDSQILTICSKFQKSGLRMVHLPSLTVFPNWPTAQTPLGYIQDFSFSANSGYFAGANQKGKVLLYRLKHYDTV